MRLGLTLCALWIGAAVSYAQEAPLELGVGLTGELRQVVLPGPELVVAPLDRDAPLVLRITAVSPHGSAHRYDFELYGLEAGDYDLTELLARADGEPRQDLPAQPVRVVDRLPLGQVEPLPLEPGPLPALGGYRRALIAGAVLWALGLVALLGVGRRRGRARAEAAQAPPGLADRLRPLVEAARAGTLEPARQAELERLLLSVWRRRLGLSDLPPAQALARIRADAAGGELLRQLEAWLHQPPGRGEAVDVEALLAPYAHVRPEETDA